jgi:hypothetical protein
VWLVAVWYVSKMLKIVTNSSKVMQDGSVSSMLTPADKMKINSAIIKGKSLIDNHVNQHAETCVA